MHDMMGRLFYFSKKSMDNSQDTEPIKGGEKKEIIVVKLSPGHFRLWESSPQLFRPEGSMMS